MCGNCERAKGEDAAEAHPEPFIMPFLLLLLHLCHAHSHSNLTTHLLFTSSPPLYLPSQGVIKSTTNHSPPLCYSNTAPPVSVTVSRTRRQKRFLLPFMACLSQHTWLPLPNKMLSPPPLPPPTTDDDEHDPYPTLSSAYHLEKVFPVYAMGSVPDPGPAFALDRTDPIWIAVTQEAKLEAEKEPILSSFLYASILAHDCLEQALAFVVANRLQNATLLATQLMDIFCNVIMHDKGIQRSIRLDVQAFKDRDPACLSYCSAILYMKGYHSLQVHRIAHALWHQGRKVLALALQSRVSEVFGVDIHPAAKIGEGILLDHGTGVVIGETAIIGNRVSLMHGVTLGGTGKEIGDRHPKVGEGALIGASATILGNIRIGEGAMIAAGSLVLKEVPPHSVVAGIPTKVLGSLREHDPSLTMKHDATKDFFIADNFRHEKPTGAQTPDRNDVNT